MPSLLQHQLKAPLSLTEVELRALAGIAYQYGWQRENPRKAWTTAEYKEAARFAAAHLVHEAIGSKPL